MNHYDNTLSSYDLVYKYIALVLSVLSLTDVSHVMLYRTKHRPKNKVAEARKLLIWAFMEISRDGPEIATVLLSHFTGLCLKTITESLKSEPPDALESAIARYHAAVTMLGPDDIKHALACGILGELPSTGRHVNRKWYANIMTELRNV